MNTSGFYKKELFELLFAANFVYTPNNQLIRDLAHTYTYPVDGWTWFDSAQQAYNYYGLPYTEVVYDNKTDLELQAQAISDQAAVDIAALFGKPAKSMDLIITQQNYTARSVSLVEKMASGITLTVEEQGELNAIKNLWSAIKSIRATAAAAIAALT
jgi:hypothetical protein